MLFLKASLLFVSTLALPREVNNVSTIAPPESYINVDCGSTEACCFQFYTNWTNSFIAAQQIPPVFSRVSSLDLASNKVGEMLFTCQDSRVDSQIPPNETKQTGSYRALCDADHQVMTIPLRNAEGTDNVEYHRSVCVPILYPEFRTTFVAKTGEDKCITFDAGHARSIVTVYAVSSADPAQMLPEQFSITPIVKTSDGTGDEVIPVIKVFAGSLSYNAQGRLTENMIERSTGKAQVCIYRHLEQSQYSNEDLEVHVIASEN